MKRPEDWDNGPEYKHDTLRPEACAKNVLTVGSGNHSGSISAFSSGPTDDGRMKVDVLASGGGADSQYGWVSDAAYAASPTSYGVIEGTSFAAPVVTGGLALVRQLWVQRRGASPEAVRILDFAETAPDVHTLSWGSNVGAVYRVQSSDVLGSWTDVAPVTDIIATAEITSFDLSTASGGDAEFFRVRRLAN